MRWWVREIYQTTYIHSKFAPIPSLEPMKTGKTTHYQFILNLAICMLSNNLCIIDDLISAERWICIHFIKYSSLVSVINAAQPVSGPRPPNPVLHTQQPGHWILCVYILQKQRLGRGLDGRGITVRFLNVARDLYIFCSVRTGSRIHPAPYAMGCGGSFPGCKAAGPWRWHSPSYGAVELLTPLPHTSSWRGP
jgi:hypothetical protein